LCQNQKHKIFNNEKDNGMKMANPFMYSTGVYIHIHSHINIGMGRKGISGEENSLKLKAR